MATQLWNQEIDKTVDWGGDTSTGGAAVSGQFVQKFIKDTLAKKFGYLNYDRVNLKYQVFADEADYTTWNADPMVNANLLLATFDAPAPASIHVSMVTPENVTILSSEKNQKITFNYYIMDTSNNLMNEQVNVRVLFTNNGISQTYTTSFEPDYDGYNKMDEETKTPVGTTKSINIDDYLSIGTNNITITFTGASTQASTVKTVKYTVVELAVESSFDNSVGQLYDSLMDPDMVFDEDNGNVIKIPFICSGQGRKYIEIFVNGEPLSQSDIRGAISSGDIISDANEYRTTLALFMTNTNGRLRAPFVDGKNSIQFRIFIDGGESTKIYSRTLYYDIVIADKNSSEDLVYILYKQEFNNKDFVFKPTDTISFDTQQYSSTSFDYSVYSSSGKKIELLFTLTKRPENEGDSAEVIATQTRQINSGEVDTFQYSFMTYGVIDVNITTALKGNDGRPLDSLNVVVNVEMSDVQIAVSTDGLRLNLEALNRSNSEPEDQRGVWKVNNVDTVKFNNIYFNDASGWDGKALVLNNGANIEIPYNVFGTDVNALRSNGVTFEITFEMVNVQEEEAVMLEFRDSANKSYIAMTACGAMIGDQTVNDPYVDDTVHTRFNANTKIKLAFTINPYDANYKGEGTTYKNCIFCTVNGILDRAGSYNGNIIWQNPSNPTIKIGDPNGKAGIKVYSVRVYNKALSLDEELTNWIAETDEILKNYDRNNIYDETGKSVSLNIMKQRIPTAVLYGNIDTFNKLGNKKDNQQFDIEFYDPTDPDRDFFARGCWISNQGTSSLSYPIRNLRPYFSKTVDSKTQEKDAHYYTEVYLSGEFVHEQTNDESTLGHFYTNAKTTKTSKYYHKLYNREQALKLEADGEQIFYKVDSKTFIPCTVGVDDDGKEEWYVYGYRVVKNYGTEGTDDTWKFLKDLRLSGCKIYTKDSETEVENPNSGNVYKVLTFAKVKSKKALDPEKTYYIDQAVWKQYHKSGYTDRWTWKADYASSDMCNNAGVGRLWGDVMKNFSMGNGENPYRGRTDAQTAVGNLVTKDDERIDIRTSCDGKPMVMYICPIVYEEDGVTPVIVDGKRKYGDPIFAGLYNIMTDKSSTKLFGFEDIYDENGNCIYKADRTECWECLSNMMEFPMGVSLASDGSDKANTSMGNRKPLWDGYEARWPDVKVDDGQTAHTMNLERFWRFINFCKPAVDYKIGGVDGYTLAPYSKVNSEEEVYELWNRDPRPVFATGEASGGNMHYEDLSLTSIDEVLALLSVLYVRNDNIDYNNATHELTGAKIPSHVYIGKAATFDAKHGVFLEDIQFDAERVDNAANGITYFDPDSDEQDPDGNYAIAGSPVEEDYYTEVFLEQNGSSFRYIDEYGEYQTYRGSIDRDDYVKNSKNESYAGKTYMEFFSEQKYNYLDVYRVAAYYIYLMRFAAVDQVVKNSMLTTEDGKHYFYINYDNDTVLGVRNDGELIYHWNINRLSYDATNSAFCFAGDKSVLWNLLEMDEDFMDVVQQVDNAMYSSNVLSAEIALDMFNNKQEGSWGERMYNINEEFKYLSQFTGSGDFYLKFIHGSSNQYRSWFITNRFNYYDSLWESGKYKTNAIRYYLDISGTDGKTPFLAITAARQNKFWVYNSDGNMKNLPQWKIQLNQDETAEWPAIYNVKGASSPWDIYGTDKIKVLDFRYAVKNESMQLQQLILTPGINWAQENGCLMTKLLIGWDDAYRETAYTRYTNISDTPAILTVIDLTAAVPYTSNTKLPGELPADVTMEEVDGKFIYSTTSSDTIQLPTVIINPGEYVDRETMVVPVDGDKIVDKSLERTVCAIATLENIDNIYSLEEIDLRNCFGAKSLGDIKIDTLSNLHKFRAIGSSITSFIPAVGVNLNEVSLPAKRITTLTLDNVTFSQGYDEEGNEVETFKYTPDYALRNLTIKNISQSEENPVIDIVEFINTWMDAYKEQFADSSTESLRSLKNLSLTLEGVNITATVDWLVKLKELNLISFTGDVYVINSEDDIVLTQEQYELLSELYANERPFEISSALRFSAAEATFWTVKGANHIKLGGYDNAESWNTDVVLDYYEILHGETLEFRATSFPLVEEARQRYSFQYLTGNNTDLSRRPWSNQAPTPAGATDNRKSISDTTVNMVLIPNQYGNSTFLSSIDGITSRNNIQYLRIYPINERNGKDGDAIYVKLNKVVNPSSIKLYMDGELVESLDIDGIGQATVTMDVNDKVHEFEIKYANEDEITVDSTLPRVSFSQENESDVTSNSYGDISDIRLNQNKKTGSSFKLSAKIQPSTTETTVYINAPFNTGLSTTGKDSKKFELTMRAVTKSPKYVELNIPEEYEGNKLVDFENYTIEKEIYDELGALIETKKINTVKLKVYCILPANGIKFPIKTYYYNNDGSKNYDVNVPIKLFNENELGNGFSNSFVNEPTFGQFEDGEWYMLVSPKTSNKGANTYNEEYNICATGQFGYNTENWSDVNAEDWSFNYDFRFDASVIYPNKIRIETEEGANITEKPLVICASDGAQKEFILNVIPYYNIDTYDDITVDVEYDTEAFKFIESSNENGIIFDEVNEFTYFTPERFVQAELITNGTNYPQIKLTLNKYVGGEGEVAQDYVLRLNPKFEISLNYKDPNNKTVTVSNTNIEFVVEQSLSSYGVIDDCEPYEINIGGETVICPWYFVDASNQYYKFDADTLMKLQSRNKMNSLVGIAKRINYGWGGDAFNSNVELNGNPMNNACMIWENEPNISILNYKSGNPAKIVAGKQGNYYRALCIPLANWNVTDEMMYKGTSPLFLPTGPNSTNWQNKKDEVETYGAWVLDRARIGLQEGQVDWTNGIMVSPFGSDYSDYVNGNVIPTIASAITAEKLHKNLTSSNDISLNVYTRNTTDIVAPNNPNVNTSPIQYMAKAFLSCNDERNAMKALCTGKMSDWAADLSSARFLPEVESILDGENVMQKLTWPGYGGMYNRSSGLLDTWFHFVIYKDTALVCPKDENSITDLSKLRCYMANMFEVESFFNGDIFTGSSKEPVPMQINNGYNNASTMAIRTVDEDGQPDEYNSEEKTTNTMPYGIYQLYSILTNSGCKNVFESNGGSNLFIESLYKWFESGTAGNTLANTGFGTLNLWSMGVSGITANSVGWNNTIKRFAIKESGENGNGSLTAGTWGTSRTFLYLPLLIVD